jgi:hypothetical protein
MPTLRALVLILLASPVLAADPAPAAGWRAARFGMTPEEVLAAFPGEAVRLSPEVKLADGNTIPVGIDGYVLEGLTFDVRFVFTAGRLALVSLRTPAKKPVDAQAYARLRDALVKAWGPPLEETKDDAFIDMRQTRWNRGPDRADLKYIPGVVAIVHYPGRAAQ